MTSETPRRRRDERRRSRLRQCRIWRWEAPDYNPEVSRKRTRGQAVKRPEGGCPDLSNTTVMFLRRSGIALQKPCHAWVFGHRTPLRRRSGGPLAVPAARVWRYHGALSSTGVVVVKRRFASLTRIPANPGRLAHSGASS